MKFMEKAVAGRIHQLILRLTKRIAEYSNLIFPDLNKTDSTFEGIENNCKYISDLLKEDGSGTSYIKELSGYMVDLAQSISDESNEVIIDSIVMLEYFIQRANKI